jgi:hypothetical protein
MPKSQQQPRPRAPRSPARFTRSESRRLLKSALDSGVPVRGIEVDTSTGALRVLFGKPNSDPAESQERV